MYRWATVVTGHLETVIWHLESNLLKSKGRTFVAPGDSLIGRYLQARTERVSNVQMGHPEAPVPWEVNGYLEGLLDENQGAIYRVTGATRVCRHHRGKTPLEATGRYRPP